MEFRVNIYIETSRRGPSKGPGKYMYILEYIKKDGTPYTRDGIESFKSTCENELVLKAIIAAGKRFEKPCLIRIFTGCNHVLSTTHNGWHIEWQKKRLEEEKRRTNKECCTVGRTGSGDGTTCSDLYKRRTFIQKINARAIRERGKICLINLENLIPVRN